MQLIPIHRIINSDYHPKEFIRDLWTTITNGEIWKGELKNKAKDGSIYWVDTTIVPFLNENSKPYQYVAIRADITERKKAEELIIANKEEKEKRAAELIIANKELLFQSEEKEKRAEELIIANKELESFNYISSHDLQEPLRKIQTFTTRIIADESQNLSEKGKEYFLRINDSASRMQTLIDDLLAYSRIATAKRKFETTDLATITKEVKNDFKEVIAEKHATIEIGEMGAANIIPFQFRQVMHNLIGNALKFSRADELPYIIIKRRNIKGSEVKNQKLLPEEDYCHVTVADNGIGFDPQYKEYIFEIFRRLHDKEKITGTGIGLTIVKRIIDNHHGVITAKGDLNKGATFDIYIPFLPR